MGCSVLYLRFIYGPQGPFIFFNIQNAKLCVSWNSLRHLKKSKVQSFFNKRKQFRLLSETLVRKKKHFHGQRFYIDFSLVPLTFGLLSRGIIFAVGFVEYLRQFNICTSKKRNS